MDYYDILNLSKNSTYDEIISSFKILAKKYHPDLNKEANAQRLFIELYEAYSILKDPEKRKAYDKIIKNDIDIKENNENINNWKNKADEEAEFYSKMSYSDLEKFWDSFDKGYYFYKDKYYKKAIDFLTIALNIREYHAAFFFRACAYEDSGDYKNAITDFNKAIILKQDDATYLYFRGTLLVRLKRETDAFNDFSKAILINNFPDAYKDRGNIYIRQGNYDMGIKDYKKALEYKPNDARMCYNLALALKEGKNDNDSALYYYKKAIEYDNSQKEAYNGIGNIYYDMEKYNEAISYFSKAINLGNGISYYNRANAYYLLKQYKNAIADYTETIKINKYHKNAYNNRGLAYKAIGKFIKYKLDMTKAKELKDE
jgi:tetratricopeptide (TPR) repeat protein